MRTKLLLILRAVCLLVLAVASPRAGAQSKAQPFDQGMTRDEAIKWLGQHLSGDRIEVSKDLSRNWTYRTRIVKAKGCTLSYWSNTESDAGDPVTYVYQKRELWTLDLRGLDPERVNGLEPGYVWFHAASSPLNSIRTVEYRDDRVNLTREHRTMGRFFVRNKADADEVASALRHVVTLCRQEGQK